MKINVHIKRNEGMDPRLRVKKTNMQKMIDRNVASSNLLSTATIAGVTLKAANTVVFSTYGSRYNDQAKQNQVDNIKSVAGRGLGIAGATAIGAKAGGLPGAAVGFILGAINEGINGFQRNIDWRLNAIENKFKSMVEFEAIGMSTTDLNR